MRRCLSCMEEYAEHLSQCPNCGYSMDMVPEKESALEAGSILQGRYIVGVCREIRKSDIIYIGWDELFHRKVQIIEFFPVYCCPVRSGRETVSVYSSKEEFFDKGKRQFLTYGKKLLWLYREDDIATVYSCFEENATAYLITQYCDLPTVGEVFIQDTRTVNAVSMHTALNLLSSGIEAVEKIHDIGVYHGQISVDSFWVTEDKRLILKDLGSWLYVCGEPGGLDYQNGGPWTDVYGLVSMFCQLVTGTAVYPGIQVESVIADSGIVKRANLNRAVLNALEESAARRTGSVEELSLQIYGKKKAGSRRNKRNKSLLPKISWKVYACGAVLLTVLVAATVVLYHSNDGRKIDIVKSTADGIVIENLINQRYEKVLKSHDIAETEIKVVAKGVSDPKTVEGVIVEQKPGAGETAKSDVTIEVIVESADIVKEIPEILGIQVDEARKLLFEEGFRTRVEETEYEAVPGSIVTWRLGTESQEEENTESRMPEGDTAHLGTEIVLVKAKTSGKKLSGKGETAEVPDLRGKDYEAAEKILKECGLYIIKGREIYSDEQAENEVVTQSAEAGSQAIRGETNVVVTVSRGREPAVIPDVVQKPEEDAKKELEAAGLVVELHRAYDDSVKKGVVMKQEPGAGTGRKGDKVNVTVSLGRKPEETKVTETVKETKGTKSGNEKNAGSKKEQKGGASQGKNGQTNGEQKQESSSQAIIVPEKTEAENVSQAPPGQGDGSQAPPESGGASQESPEQGGASQTSPKQGTENQDSPTKGEPTPGGPAAENPPVNPNS